MIYDEADYEYVLLTNELGHGLIKARRRKPRTSAKRATTKHTTVGFQCCATCRKQRRSHVWFRGLLWCPAKDYRTTDDSMPIYLLTWRDF